MTLELPPSDAAMAESLIDELRGVADLAPRPAYAAAVETLARLMAGGNVDLALLALKNLEGRLIA